MTLANWFCRRCHSILFVDYRASADALGAYRVVFALASIVVLPIPRIGWIAAIPTAFFNPPPGLARLLPGFPPDLALVSIDVAVVLLLVALLVGWHTCTVSIALTAVNIYGHLLEFSLGKIDHDVIAVLTPLLFAWSWGHSFSVDALRQKQPPRPTGLARGLLACLLAFGFFTAGLPKLVRWLDFDLSTHGVMSWVLNAEGNGRGDFLVPYFSRLENPWVWEALDIAAIGFEISLVALLFVGPIAFKGWCVLAVLFHLFNYLMLNISFSSHLPLYLAFAGWESIAGPAGLMGRGFSIASRMRPASMAGVVVLATIGLLRVMAPATALADAKWRTLAVLAAASAVALTMGVRGLLARLRNNRSASVLRRA